MVTELVMREALTQAQAAWLSLPKEHENPFVFLALGSEMANTYIPYHKWLKGCNNQSLHCILFS